MERVQSFTWSGTSLAIMSTKDDSTVLTSPVSESQVCFTRFKLFSRKSEKFDLMSLLAHSSRYGFRFF